jgi:hypothetical protein
MIEVINELFVLANSYFLFVFQYDSEFTSSFKYNMGWAPIGLIGL